MNKHYIRDDYEGITSDRVDEIERDFNARVGAIMIVIALLVALFFFSQETKAEAKCSAWSDTTNRYVGERSDTNINTCTAPADCKTKLEADAKTYGANRTSGYAYFTFQSEMRCDFVKPTPTCPAKPADLSRPGTCPVGTVGEFTQTQTHLSQPYPACWQPSGVWVPATSGACVTPPPPAGPELGPAPPSSWIDCAGENARCVFNGEKAVSYGAGTRWTKARVFTGGVDCNNGVFGDPVSGTVKRCWREPDPVTPGSGQARLDWRSDNPAGLVAKFTVKQATAITGPWSIVAEVPDNTLTYTVTGLSPGIYWWHVTATARLGEESAASTLLSKQVGP